LHTVSTVDLELAIIVFPHDAELDNSLRYRDNIERGLVLRVLFKESAVLES
jgi:hypothetical protein